MSESITGEQFALSAGPYQAIITESGASLRELTHDGLPLVLSHGADEPAPAAFGHLLIPWPNRVDHGRYDYGGASHQLDISEPARDCAIHGLVRWAPWRAAEHEPGPFPVGGRPPAPHGTARVRLTHRLLATAGYPFRLDLEAEYSLDAADGLRVRITARNSGAVTAPYGHGSHPYLTVGEPIDACRVTLGADRYVPVDERMVPSGPSLDVTGGKYDLRAGPLLSDRVIDNAFTDLNREGDGRVWVTLAGGARTVRLWADEAHPWMMIYTADNAPSPREGLGVEPMTCPPNAFATGEGLVHLEPGAEYTGTYGIQAAAL
ncbi:aldose 1-epimerase family protein [Actinomadura sp. 7K507]|uniref:aldose 1-epimerase family protein n=1 Tax=Actinomadura sp. 7K507 TaxID=2530365 RepID=UPI0010527A22|nr:aldose 1-epimerase family protein [Actinomadura sp. 7K507]TDC88947.1 aldose epimerase [Actinomadura sp. 7K507]